MDATDTESNLPFPLRQGLAVDWTELPADLVAAICRRLHDLFDFVYFRAVCKKWRAATSISDLPPQFPWILQHDYDSEHLEVYSLFSGKTRTIHCPKSRGKYLSRSSHGYLYTVDPYRGKSAFSLLNPLTNYEMVVELEKQFGSMAPTSPDIMGKNFYLVFLSRTSDRNTRFYEPYSREWSYADLPLPNTTNSSACFNGLYYVIDIDTGNTVVFDIVRGSSFSVPPLDNLDGVFQQYFVESAGKILRIVKRSGRGSVSSNFNYSFDIYQLDLIDKNCGYRWIKISNIDNQILFLDWFSGISVAASESSGLRRNSIYCLEICRGGSGLELYRYNIDDGQAEIIHFHFHKCSFLFMLCITGSLSVGPC